MLTKLTRFEYFKPSSISEALELLNTYDGQAKLLAGGTDLLVGMKEKGLSPKYLIDVKGIPGLDSIDYKPGLGLTIGALTTMNAVASSPVVKAHCPFLSHAAGEVGSVQVRNRATIGGNLCNAAPSAETAPSLLCMDAELRCQSLKGERIIPLEDFFKGPGMTILDKEVLTQIRIPDGGRRGVYIKHSPRRAMDIAVVGVAVAITEKEGRWEDVRIALGAVAPTPIRVREAEQILAGKVPTLELIKNAALVSKKKASPIFDVRASSEYRREMVDVLVKRALMRLSGLQGEK